MISDDFIKAEKGELKGRERLFHIREDAWGKRRIPWWMPVIDDKGKLHLWAIHKGEYVEMKTPDKPGAFEEGVCFAHDFQSENDVYIEFFHIMYQRSNGGNIMRWIKMMVNDFYILAVEIAKIGLYYKLIKEGRLENWEVQRFVWSDFEYIFVVCRRLFDLLQKVVCGIWKRLKFDDASKTKQQLPESFNDMLKKVLDEKVDTEKKYGLFPQWRDFYLRHVNLFNKLRDYRGGIVHSRVGSEIIFVVDKGFAISPNIELFKSFGVWKEETFFNKNLAPLRPIIAFVIYKTIEAIEDFAAVIKGLPFPDEIAPGYGVIMVGPHIHRLKQMKEVLDNKPWEADWVKEEKYLKTKEGSDC